MKGNSHETVNGRNQRIGVRRAVWHAAAILMAGLFVAGTMGATPNTPQSKKTSTAAPVPYKAYGTSSAPIKMEVFSDYECPSCRAFYDQTLREMIRTYVASGKVYLIHRDYPLEKHRYSGEAARWANACAEVGEFGAAEAVLYDTQDAWGADGNVGKFIAASMPAADFKRVEAVMKGSAMPAPQAMDYAADPMTGVNHPCQVDRFIVQDIEMGYQIRMPGTPTFVITYKEHSFAPISNVVSWPVLKGFFDSLLQQ